MDFRTSVELTASFNATAQQTSLYQEICSNEPGMQPVRVHRNFPQRPPCVARSSASQKRSKGYVKIAQNAKDALATRRKKKPLKT